MEFLVVAVKYFSTELQLVPPTAEFSESKLSNLEGVSYFIGVKKLALSEETTTKVFSYSSDEGETSVYL